MNAIVSQLLFSLSKALGSWSVEIDKSRFCFSSSQPSGFGVDSKVRIELGAIGKIWAARLFIGNRTE